MPSLLQRWPATRDALNDRVARSAVGHWFRLEGCGHPLERPGSRFTTEIRAGLVTFASVVYIVALNPSIVSSTGGPCVAAPGVNRATDEAYQICVQEVRQEYIIVTAALSTLATGLIGIFANMPLALSTGLGVNSYFASIVGQYGVGGSVTYGQACGAVFVEGLLFFFLSLIGLRQWLARLMPRSLTISVSVAIGLFLALIGLGPAGLGVVGGDYIDLVGLGGCLPEFQDANGYCESHVLRSPKMWVGIFVGGIFTALLSIYRVRGAFLWPILLVAIISWPRSTPVTLFPHTATGDAAFDFFKQVARWTPLDKLGPQNIDWSGFGNGQVWIALITFLYVDALDTTGTMTAMSRAAGLYNEVAGDFEGSTPAFLADSGCISIGALMGSSPCTAFVESAAGIAEGGRTGITACTTAFCFFLTLFFAPIFSSIPSWATGSTLVIVGSLMAANARTINWDYAGDAIPAFVTIVLVPFTYNIAYGIIGGACTFIILHNVPKMLGRIHPSLLPPGHDTIKEPYSLGMTLSSGGNGLSGWRAFVPPWLRKALSGERHFWKQTDEEIRSTLEGRRITDARTQARASQAAREREEMRATMTQGPQEGGAFKDHDLEAGLRNVRSRNAPQQQSQAQHDEIEKLRDEEEPASPDASSKGE